MPKPVIGVVGLGTMGLGIAQVYAVAEHRVLTTDQHPPARETALARLGETLSRRVAAGKMTEAARDETLARITVADTVAGLSGADMVIEAITEDIGAKRALIGELEAILAPDAILATNTSALSVGDLAQGLARPDRVLGLHFFNPAPAMKLVELVAAPTTADWALEKAGAMTVATGKVVIRCADRPGFIVNRCARPFYGEALAMVEEGREPREIDAAMQEAGYRLGPFSLIDLIGADINLAATEGIFRGMAGHPRYHPFAALQRQVAKGDLGRKTGRGFIFPAEVGAAPADADAIVLRIEAALANEAASLLDEGTSHEEDIDMAVRLGLNFPHGPFEAARARGIDRVLNVLVGLEAQAPSHLKGRYAVSPSLAAMAPPK